MGITPLPAMSQIEARCPAKGCGAKLGNRSVELRGWFETKCPRCKAIVRISRESVTIISR